MRGKVAKALRRGCVQLRHKLEANIILSGDPPHVVKANRKKLPSLRTIYKVVKRRYTRRARS